MQDVRLRAAAALVEVDRTKTAQLGTKYRSMPRFVRLDLAERAIESLAHAVRPELIRVDVP